MAALQCNENGVNAGKRENSGRCRAEAGMKVDNWMLEMDQPYDEDKMDQDWCRK